MNPAIHPFYKASVLAIRSAALAAALLVTTSASAVTDIRQASPVTDSKGGGVTPRPNPTRTSCATTIRASRSTWGSDCGAFRCPWTTTATA